MNFVSARPVSLRRLIVTRIGVLLGITVLLVTTVFVFLGVVPMAEQSAQDKFNAATVRVRAGLDAVLTPPVRLLRMSAGWLDGTLPDTQDPQAFNRLFEPVLRENPQITSVVAGNGLGQGWLLLRQPDGVWRNRMTDVQHWGRERHEIIERDLHGHTVRRWVEQPYDPRTRPWYEAALTQPPSGVAWTPPYVFFTTGDPGITVASRLPLRNGTELVLGFDLMLRDLSESTRTADVGVHGLALVMTEDERVLALPAASPGTDPAQWVKQVLKPVVQLGLAPLDDALVRWHAAGRTSSGVLHFRSGGVRWLASLWPYPLGAQTFWVVTLAPASDFAPAWWFIAGSTAGSLVLVLALLVWFSRLQTAVITRPLERLAQVSQRVAQLDFAPAGQVRSPVREIRQLGIAQDAMLGVLRSNQIKLDDQAQTLHAQIAALTAAQLQLHAQNDLLGTIIENFPGGISVCDAQLRMIAYNRHFRDLLEMPDSLFEKPVVWFEDLIRHNALRGDYGPGDPQQHVVAIVERARRFEAHQFERTLPNGTVLDIRGMPLPEGGFVTLYLDISQKRRADERDRLAASVFTHAREGILMTSADGTILDVNDSFARITGYSRDEAIGQNPRLLNSGIQPLDFYRSMWRELIDHGQWHGELWNRCKDGRLYAESLTISAVHDAQGKVSHYVALFSDITTIKEHERELEHIAHYDALTSLPNRVLLADRLQQAKAQAVRRGQRLAVAYLDLDGFKGINDHFGHDAGDQVLMAISQRMKQALREGDTLARLGGDEFVAVLLDLDDHAAVVPMLTRLLNAAAEPLEIEGNRLQVSASLGVSFYPQAEDVDADLLLRQADQAMYQAKQAGKNRYHIFDAEHDRNVRGHHESLQRIQRALVQGEFVLHYQPKVNMRSGMVVGAEALIRWQHPDKGLLPPAVFLPVIEDHALAIEVGEWVIQSALRQIEDWHAAGLDLAVSVNVGARQLQQNGFVERLRTILGEHPWVHPSSLEIEVLETSALEDMTRVSQVIEDCKRLGVLFALDDFGTGYSSLTYLKRLPVTTLKIDRSFVRDMLDDPDDLSILDGVLGLAMAFGREVIAEGVESPAHGAMLLQLGCHLAQGFGIAKPMPAENMAVWVRDWRLDPAWESARSVPRSDLPLVFASVEHRAWIAALGQFVQGERALAPALELRECRLGRWLETEGRARIGAVPAVQAVETLHQRVHALAQQLLACHASGNPAQTLQMLAQLHALRDKLLAQLAALANQCANDAG